MTISSKINGISYCLVTSLNPSKNPGFGGITLWNTTTGAHSVSFGDGYSGTDRYEGFVEYMHNGDYMRFGTDHTERMRITSAGKVGIGTTSPGYNLVVNSTGNSILQIKSGDTSWGSLYFGEQSNAYRGIMQYNHASDYMSIYTAAAEKIRINSSGRRLKIFE